MSKESQNPDKNIVQKGFNLDKGVNRALIAGGLGVAAVGAVIAAPAIVSFGAVVAGGSIAGLEISKRIEHGYNKSQSKNKLGNKAIRSSSVTYP